MKCKVWFAVLLMLALSVLVVSAEEIEIYTQETLSQAGEGYFILEGDTFRKLPVNLAGTLLYSNDRSWYFADLPDDELWPVVLDRSTAQLVTTKNPGYRYIYTHQMGDFWWTCPILLTGSEEREWFKGMRIEKQYLGFHTALSNADIWEVEGVEYTSLSNWHNGISAGTNGYVGGMWDGRNDVLAFAAWNPTTITLGGYHGTAYVSETLTLHDWLICPLRNNISCDVVHTKNGYFIIDLSKLEPGFYQVESRLFQLVDSSMVPE